MSRRWARPNSGYLVATDCLSEGINLQDLFDTVVHYDLSWNPTRHQQREGRVDRFGQRAPLVRSALLYSPDSAIDGAVLDVILRKAEAIRKATGVTVPLPEERGAVTGALMNAVLLRKKGKSHRQLAFDFGSDVAAVETRWRDAEEGERRSRARFAQNAIKPEEVAPEWQRWRELLGGSDRGSPLCRTGHEQPQRALELVSGVARAHLAHLPQGRVRTHRGARTQGHDPRLLSPSQSPPEPRSSREAIRCRRPWRRRCSKARLDGSGHDRLGRVGAWPTNVVVVMTIVALLRLRFKLTVHGRRRKTAAGEEANALALGTDVTARPRR